MLTIRKLSAEELSDLRPFADRALVGEAVHLKISRLGFQLDYLPMPKAEWRTFLPVPFADPAIITQDDASAFFAAFADGKYIGSAAVTTHPSGWAEVLDVRVDPAWRRKGVATALLGQCGFFCEERGLHGLRISATDANPALCRLCERLGFILSGLDRMALTRDPEERVKPLLMRASLLFFYLPIEKG
ncbi:MAG: GNAT family N-acetyltransferase [Clostridia bacterium]|nr:GNAT family N-acetyltransferase [Clostridia bacterium]